MTSERRHSEKKTKAHLGLCVKNVQTRAGVLVSIIAVHIAEKKVHHEEDEM